MASLKLATFINRVVHNSIMTAVETNLMLVYRRAVLQNSLLLSVCYESLAAAPISTNKLFGGVFLYVAKKFLCMIFSFRL